MKARVINYSKLPFLSLKTSNCSPYPALAEWGGVFLPARMEHWGMTAQAGSEPAARAAPSAASPL